MSNGSRLAILTQYASAQSEGGLEVFNRCLGDTFGSVEAFTDGGPDEWYGDLGHLGLGEPAAALKAARALLRRHREEPFDIILSNGLYGWPLTLARPGVPLVQVYHCTIVGYARRASPLRSDRLTKGRVMARFERIAGMGKHVVAVSDRVRRELEAFYGLRGQVIPNGVDTQTFRPLDREGIRESLALPPDAVIGLFVGRPDYTKGFDILLRVARRMPQILFLVAGGPCDGGLENVRSVGKISHRAMAQWYGACDFLFLPSRYEGFPFATLEALSCDRPVVVSGAAWAFLEAPSQCGVVVESDSESDYVAAIRQVLSDGASFAPRRFVVPRYDIASFERSWRGFMNSLLEQPARVAG